MGMSGDDNFRPLNPGECRVILTLNEREFLHFMLNVAEEQPEVFGGLNVDRLHPAATLAYRQLISRMRRKLPRPGAGTYKAAS